MKQLLIVIALLVLSAPLSAARRHKITVTLHSEPEGAQVLMNDARTPVGSTPLDLKYEITGDCARMQGTGVRWASGATAEFKFIDLCAKVGKHQQLILTRPPDVEGYAIDLQVAYQQALVAQMRAQMAALDYDLWLQNLPAAQRAVAAPKPFALCVSRDVARGVIYVACQ